MEHDHLEQFRAAQFFKKIPCFYATWKFVTVFTTCLHWIMDPILSQFNPSVCSHNVSNRHQSIRIHVMYESIEDYVCLFVCLFVCACVSAHAFEYMWIWMIRGSRAGRGCEFLFSPPRPDRLWSPPSLLSNGYHQQGLFAAGSKAVRSWSWLLASI